MRQLIVTLGALLGALALASRQMPRATARVPVAERAPLVRGEA